MGVLGSFRVFATEFGPTGIRVNSVAPGLTQTDITKEKMTDTPRSETESSLPPGRLGVSLGMANARLFLASGLSDYISGTVINVDGGMQKQE